MFHGFHRSRKCLVELDMKMAYTSIFNLLLQERSNCIARNLSNRKYSFVTTDTESTEFSSNLQHHEYATFQRRQRKGVIISPFEHATFHRLNYRRESFMTDDDADDSDENASVTTFANHLMPLCDHHQLIFNHHHTCINHQFAGPELGSDAIWRLWLWPLPNRSQGLQRSASEGSSRDAALRGARGGWHLSRYSVINH